MHQFTPPHFTDKVICSHCFARVYHPRWALVDRGLYQALCFPCFDRRQAEFTTEYAVWEAIAIVAMHQAHPIGGAA